MVQKIAVNENMLSEVIPSDEKLINRLEDARDEDNPVIIIIDPLSLYLMKYQEVILQFNQRDFYNEAVYVLLNMEDKETERV